MGQPGALPEDRSSDRSARRSAVRDRPLSGPVAARAALLPPHRRAARGPAGGRHRSGRLPPRVPRCTERRGTGQGPGRSFRNLDRALVLHRDDRGLDLLAADRQTRRPLYQHFHCWLLEYDRGRMDRMFQWRSASVQQAGSLAKGSEAKRGNLV
ncbi:DUF3885 domain-containing protein [Hymenobacter arizonensis]|uniref:DUF3885 domain-containing protein n=1 Tax=Hymenobacter arizonensis TaxID=1227077 RepID=UPI000B80E3B5